MMVRIVSMRAKYLASIPRELLQRAKVDMRHFDLHNQSIHVINDHRWSFATIPEYIGHELLFKQELRNPSFDLGDFEFAVFVIQEDSVVPVEEVDLSKRNAHFDRPVILRRPRTLESLFRRCWCLWREYKWWYLDFSRSQSLWVALTR